MNADRHTERTEEKKRYLREMRERTVVYLSTEFTRTTQTHPLRAALETGSFPGYSLANIFVSFLFSDESVHRFCHS